MDCSFTGRSRTKQAAVNVFSGEKETVIACDPANDASLIVARDGTRVKVCACVCADTQWSKMRRIRANYRASTPNHEQYKGS
jgi:hypothetical protein